MPATAYAHESPEDEAGEFLPRKSIYMLFWYANMYPTNVFLAPHREKQAHLATYHSLPSLPPPLSPNIIIGLLMMYHHEAPYIRRA